MSTAAQQGWGVRSAQQGPVSTCTLHLNKTPKKKKKKKKNPKEKKLQSVPRTLQDLTPRIDCKAGQAGESQDGMPCQAFGRWPSKSHGAGSFWVPGKVC